MILSKQKKENIEYMSVLTYNFQRIEKKYILSPQKYELISERILPCLIPDEYGKSTVNSLYLDTPDFLIARTADEAVNYKEKLRVRSYGITFADSKVFFEIKKKCDGVTYKRRVSMTYAEAEEYIRCRIPPYDTQIMREIDYTMFRWHFPRPSVLVSCEREAYFFSESRAMRITFDTNVRYRSEDKDLTQGSHGRLLLPDDTILMEFKTDSAMPLMLSRALDEYGIFPTSFSKYCAACRDIIRRKKSEKTVICNQFTNIQ